MKMIICVGISGSGKSTWVKEFLATNKDYICVNRDALRLALVRDLDGYYQRPDLNNLEQIVNSLIERIIADAEMEGYNIIIDNTNLSAKYINGFINSYLVEPLTYQIKL